jgi:hypothetical protein
MEIDKPNSEAGEHSETVEAPSTQAGQDRDQVKNEAPSQLASQNAADHEHNQFLVRFEKNDPTNHRNFSGFHKASLTFLLGLSQ